MARSIQYDACVDKPTSPDPVLIFDKNGLIHVAQFKCEKWYIPDKGNYIEPSEVLWWKQIHAPRTFELNEVVYFGKWPDKGASV